ncbi:hypothetical protein ATW97_07125 [Oenococcus oeni]|uniref:TIGR03766 family XrtG-associated glycosyltransferase n=2 Tax=Oenococcus oeni TaxID=1247 RepID=UPI0005193675|nr:TIGR03766 family XrtG-associated glycosyltransferase [Oenococcus oeni]OIL34758.1 hypothetical protein ATX10_07395 [Oenococcus oeni]OIM35124.1 hypothetical protein ATX70_07280 [Oenococcus oeni]OLQ30178.1 hypothetical protein ATW97_07125 [Oenococcus oeni]
MKRKGLFSLGNRIIFYIFNFFIFLTLYFAIASPNLTLGDTPAGNRTTWISVVFLLFLLTISLAIFVNEKLRNVFRYIFIKRALFSSIVIFVLVILLQIIFVELTHPSIGFDAGAIHSALTDTKSRELQAYYSLSTNNINLMLQQHYLAKFFSNSSWLLFDNINLFLVDLSAVFNTLIVAVLDRRKISNVLYIQSIWLALFPMILVPYSDTWVLPFVSLYLLSYCIVFHSKFNGILRVFLAIIGGSVLSASYFIKPSAIIPFIAIFLVEILYLFKKDDRRKKKYAFIILISSLFFIVSTGITYRYLQNANNSETYMKIDRSRTIPAIHFISMGMAGDGGYNKEDNLAMAARPSKKEKVEYSKRKINQRLARMGIFGYIKFLFHKQNKNSSDGSFAWLIEGHFMSAKVASKGLKAFVQSFVYPNGKHLADFRYIAQFWWIIWLFIIAFGWRYRTKFSQVLRLAIVGGFLYLLIFEGGRSRYMIQFLPVYIIVASLALNDVVEMIGEKMSWLKEE